MTARLLIGCYTPPGGHGTGIVRAAFGAELRQTGIVPAPSPAWLTVAPGGGHAYALNEADGTVTAYAIDAEGDLRRLNAVGSGGTGPAHGSLHPQGRFLLVANYGSGHVASLPVLADGSLGPAACVLAPPGTAGPIVPAHAPPGSFAHSGHDGSHAHMIATDPSGRFVLSTDLGTDRTHVWTLDAQGILHPHGLIQASPGAGPRHFTFHPGGARLFILHEEASELTVHGWDGARGAAVPLHAVSTLPEGFAGSSFASALAITTDGRFLYAANRLHNSIAIFALADGPPQLLDHVWTRGDYPNHIALAPGGTGLLACNRRSDQVTVFDADPATGGLRFTGQYLPVGSPNMVAFVR